MHLEDLVLFAAGSFGGPLCPELSAAYEALRVWQRAGKEKASTLLQAPRPGIMAEPIQADDRPDAFYDADWNEVERLNLWRSVLRDTRDLPPVLAAAIAGMRDVLSRNSAPHGVRPFSPPSSSNHAARRRIFCCRSPLVCGSPVTMSPERPLRLVWPGSAPWCWPRYNAASMSWARFWGRV